jgi:hypothetical protein
VSLAGHSEHYLHVAWTIVSALGIILGVALAVLYRRAARRAETEAIERILAEDDNPRGNHVSQRHG